MNPTITKSMTAPIVALTIEPMKPENGRKPKCVSSQTPMNAPMIPMMTFRSSPKPNPRTMFPGQPAGDRADDDHDDNAVYILPRLGTCVLPRLDLQLRMQPSTPTREA